MKAMAFSLGSAFVFMPQTLAKTSQPRVRQPLFQRSCNMNCSARSLTSMQRCLKVRAPLRREARAFGFVSHRFAPTRKANRRVLLSVVAAARRQRRHEARLNDPDITHPEANPDAATDDDLNAARLSCISRSEERRVG